MTGTFIEQASNAFSFLNTKGFSIASLRHGELVYRKGRIFVTIDWSPKSGEIEVFIGPQKDIDDQNESYSLTDILRMEGVFDERINLPFQVPHENKLTPFLRQLAEYVESYAEPALAGDRMFFRRLASYRNREARAFMTEMQIRQLRDKAETAWSNKDYAKVVELYSSVDKKHLTKIEVERLEYSRKKL